MISILDYGAGNLRSVENTLAEIGCPYTLVRDAAGLRDAARILLPGVGHFGQMMRALDALEVRAALLDRLSAGVPFLGICLGMQALFECSEEAPEVRGLGLYPGTVRRFPPHARVPHMGWNQLDVQPPARLFRGLPASPFVYFAHSYYVPPDAREGKVATDGWSKMTGHDVVDLAKKFEEYGVEAVVYTDIGRDGMLTGVNVEATVKLARELRVPVIASGGISSIKDIKDLVAYESEGVVGAIAGRALYEGTLDFKAALKAAKGGK